MRSFIRRRAESPSQSLTSSAIVAESANGKHHDGIRRISGGCQAVVILVAGFAVSRVAYFLAGVRTPAGAYTISGPLQVLDYQELRNSPFTSILYLHSQPPLFNIAFALFLHLSSGVATVGIYVVNAVLGLSLLLSTYFLLRELRIPNWLACAVALIFGVSPTTVLYENWPFYTYPTAVVLSLAALACARFFRTHSRRAGVAFFGCCAIAVLLNSSFQLPFLLGAVVLSLIVLRRFRKVVLVAAAVPLLLVLGWYVKNAVIFGTYTTSSWVGMNLAKTTLLTAPPGKVAELVGTGRLTALATLAPFQPASVYEPTYIHQPRTGVPVLDEDMKQDKVGPNLNNKAIISLSAQYLRDDIAFIKADPTSYLRSIGGAALLWFVPSDQYQLLQGNSTHIADFEQAVDHVLGLQIHTFIPVTASNGMTIKAPPWGELSYGTVLFYLVALLGAPVLIFRQRRDLAFSGTLSFLWLLTSSTFVLTSVIEYGENNRFRFDLGALPEVLAIVVLTEAWRVVRGQSTRRLPSQSQRQGCGRQDA